MQLVDVEWLCDLQQMVYLDTDPQLAAAAEDFDNMKPPAVAVHWSYSQDAYWQDEEYWLVEGYRHWLGSRPRECQRVHQGHCQRHFHYS